MARSLYGLIRASGYSGVSGQTFRNHVTGAGTGVRMTDYYLHSLTNWASGTYTPGMTVANNGTVSFTFDFNANSYFINIRRPASEIYGENTAPSDPVAECLIDSATYPTSPALTGNAITARFLGRFAYSSSMALDPGWYVDFSGAYPTGEEPPDNNDYDYHVGLNAVAPSLSNVAETFDIVYPNDPGSFNAEHRYALSLNVGQRAHYNNWDIQWSLDGSFTDLTSFDQSNYYQFLANKTMSPLTVYYRYRVTGTGPSWLVSTSTTCHFHN